MRNGLFLACFLCLAVMMSGCEKTQPKPKLGKVKGKVTLDGKPVAKASVMFTSAGGKISAGSTNENGEYTLKWEGKEDGAEIGLNTVRIESFTNEATPPNYVDPIPAKYNKNTTLKEEVKDGENTFDFTLTTK